jgi:hypothetical protein
LAEEYWNVAYQCEAKEIWEEALLHSLKLVSVDAEFDVGVRLRVPFILLFLNRDDEAYAYIRYWFKEGIPNQISRPYSVEPNCRYLDMFQQSTISKEPEMYLPYLVALAIIKMRVIAFHEAVLRTMDFAFEQTGVKRISEVQPVVREMLLGGKIDIASQRNQLHQIFDRIHNERAIHGDEEEPTMIEALLHNKRISETIDIFDLDDMLEQLYGCPERLKPTLRSSLRAVYRIPGAQAMLQSYTDCKAALKRKRKSDGSKPKAKR